MIKISKVMVAAIATAASFASHGQVTIYGRVDAAVEHISGGGGFSVTRMPTLAGSTPSLLGFRAVEDLGGGLRATAVLEMGIDPGSGALNQSGRAFGRGSTVALSGQWGSVSFGRQLTMYAPVMSRTELLGPNIYGIGVLDPYTAGPRADNSVAYVGTFGPVTVGATYSLGRDAVSCPGELSTDTKACRNASWMLKYDGGTWGVAAGQDLQRGGPNATVDNGRPARFAFTSTMTDKRTTANAYTKIGPATVAVQWIRRDNDAAAALADLTRTSDIWELGASYPISPEFTIEGELLRLKFKGSSNGSAADVVALRGVYSFSRRTAAYVTVGHIRNKGSANLSVSGGTPAGTEPGVGKPQQGVAVGIRHSF